MKQLYFIYKYYKSPDFQALCKTYRFVERVGENYSTALKILGEVFHIQNYFSDKAYRKNNSLFGFSELKIVKGFNKSCKGVSDNLWKEAKKKEEESKEDSPVLW